jgi:hypothetical protein
MGGNWQDHDGPEVKEAVSWIMRQPEAMREELFRSLFRAVYAYRITNDARGLEEFALDVLTAVNVHSVPGYDDACVSAPVTPSHEGRTVEEVFAQLRR